MHKNLQFSHIFLSHFLQKQQLKQQKFLQLMHTTTHCLQLSTLHIEQLMNP
jgi:hypothetical protein